MSEMDMVERVARALAEGGHLGVSLAFEPASDTDVGSIPLLKARDKERALAAARAAIEAMRPAPNDMLEAMHSAMFETPFDGTTLPMLGSGFDAAIDAALTTSPSTPLAP